MVSAGLYDMRFALTAHEPYCFMMAIWLALLPAPNRDVGYQTKRERLVIR